MKPHPHWCQAKLEIDNFLPKQICQNPLFLWDPTMCLFLLYFHSTCILHLILFGFNLLVLYYAYILYEHITILNLLKCPQFCFSINDFTSNFKSHRHCQRAQWFPHAVLPHLLIPGLEPFKNDVLLIPSWVWTEGFLLSQKAAAACADWGGHVTWCVCSPDWGHVTWCVCIADWGHVK